MNDYKTKLEQLKWLKSIGVNFYFSQKQPNNDILSVIQENAPPNDKDNFLDKPNIIAEKEANEANEVKNMVSKEYVKAKNNSLLDPQTLAISSISDNGARKIASEANDLADLSLRVKSFDGCDLKKFANNTVFADGASNADIMLLGEAPGASEDEQGIPFCGASGQLLDAMFKNIGYCRSKNLYISNTIFWRPPGNRRPTLEEINICRPFVEKHIALVNPKLLILVGATALSSLKIDNTKTISQMRGKYFKYKNDYMKQEIMMTAIYHPAYLLRQPAQKKTTWFDLINIYTVAKKH